MTLNHAHSLDNLAGYIVEQTIMKGVRLPEPLTRHRLSGGNSYPEALDLVRTYRTYSGGTLDSKRTIVSWAVIRAEYTDGCISQPF